MLRTIRSLAVAGLVAAALSAWMAYSPIVDLSVQRGIASYVPLFAFVTNTLLSFSAGLLTLTLTVPRRQRPWSAALLVSLILNGYWPLAFYGFWWVLIPTLGNPVAVSPLFVDVIFSGLAPAIPALLALAYTIRAARPAPLASQASQAGEEQGSLDITIEPIGSKTR